MRNRKRRMYHLLMALAGIFLVMGSVVSVQAFPRSGLPSSCGRNVTYEFTDPDGLGWTQSEKDMVSLGVNGWEVTRNYDGTQLVTVTEATPGTIDIYFERDFQGTSTYGQASCTSGFIKLNPDIRGNTLLLPIVARHEMGHVLGLGHTGDEDSFNGDNPPTMATCLSESVAATRKYAQDDAGALIFRNSGLTPEFIHANDSFEENTKYWGITGGTWTVVTGGAINGSKYLKFKPTSSADNVYQTMNFAVAGARVDARVNNARDASTDTGTVKLEIQVRSHNYGSNPACSWPTGKDQNTVTLGTWSTVATTNWVAVAPSWTSLDTPIYNVPTTWDAADARVRFYSNVKNSSGALTYVRIDNLRARDQS